MFRVLLLLFLAQSPSFETAFRAGLVALERNDLSKAQVELEAAAKLRPDEPHVWLALAQTYLKQHDTTLAESAALKAELLGGTDPTVLRGLALFYAENGKIEKAARCQTSYAAKAANDAAAYPHAVQLYLQAQNAKAAIVVAQQALSVQNRAEIRYLLGKAYALDHRPAEAFREWREAIRLNPYEESYYFDLARGLLEQNKAPEAIQALGQAKKIFAKSPQLELTLGVAYYSMRRFSDTVDAFLQTIQMDPAAEQPYVFLGRMLEQIGGKLPEVTATFSALVQASPDNYLANFLYGKALSYGGQADQAEKLLRKSIAENSKFWESHFELGAVLEGKHDLAGAEQEFKQAARINPKNSTVHYRLARVFDRLGEKDPAKAEHALHEKLTAEENAFLRRQRGGADTLQLPAE